MKKYVIFPKSNHVYHLEVAKIPDWGDWFLLAAEKRIVVQGTDAFDSPDDAWRKLIANQDTVVSEAKRELDRIHERRRKGLMIDPDDAAADIERYQREKDLARRG